MRRLIAIVAVALISSGVASAQDLKTYKATYEKSIEGIILSHGMKMTDLGNEYPKALESLLTEVKQIGDFDKTTAVMEEIKRFQKESTIPADPAEMAEIRNVQSGYKQRVSACDAVKAKKIISLISKYDRALERLQKKLVMADQMGSAKLVKEEREAVGKSTLYADALLTSETKAQPVAKTSKRSPVKAPAATAKNKALELHTDCDQCSVKTNLSWKTLQVCTGHDFWRGQRRGAPFYVREISKITDSLIMSYEVPKNYGGYVHTGICVWDGNVTAAFCGPYQGRGIHIEGNTSTQAAFKGMHIKTASRTGQLMIAIDKAKTISFSWREKKSDPWQKVHALIGDKTEWKYIGIMGKTWGSEEAELKFRVETK
jgi:hypothetical protein